MRFSNIALPLIYMAQWSSALPTDASVTALANRAPTEVDLYDDLEKRRSIDVWFATWSKGTVVVRDSISNIAEKVAENVKGLSDRDTCAHIVFYIANLAISYYTTTTGENCDTTAQTKTIRNAVTKGLQYAYDTGATASFIAMSHGGTWHGHMQVAQMWDMAGNFAAQAAARTTLNNMKNNNGNQAWREL